jgi:hypothetical protein
LQIFIARKTVQEKTKPKTMKEPKEKKGTHIDDENLPHLLPIAMKFHSRTISL